MALHSSNVTYSAVTFRECNTNKICSSKETFSAVTFSECNANKDLECDPNKVKKLFKAVWTRKVKYTLRATKEW